MKTDPSLLAFLAASPLLAPSSMFASSGNWNVDALGNWSLAGNWTPAAVPGTAAGDTVGLTNNIGGNRTVTIDTTSRTVGTLNIGDSNNSHAFTLAASGGGTLTFNNSGSGASLSETGSVFDLISAPIILADNLSVSAAGNLQISGGITESGTRSLTKSGSGALILNGASGYTGGTSITGGTLSFRTLTSKSATGTHTFSTGTVLGLGFGTGSQFTAADIQNAFAGTFTGNLAGISIGATNNIAIDTAGLTPFSANIGVSARGLVKIENAGNLVLTGANQYSGRTVVGGGNALVVNSLGNKADASSNIGTNGTIDLMNTARIDHNNVFSSDKDFNLLGATATFFGNTSNAATLSGTVSTETVGLKTLSISGNGATPSHVFSGNITDGTGQLALTKGGASQWTLSSSNNHTGATTMGGGSLILSHSLALQNSPLNTTSSSTGTSSVGLKTTVTTLTLGGLTGTKALASLFNTSTGAYNTVTALTLNPATGATHTYDAAIANGASGMTLGKTGLGTQVLTVANTYSGDTAVNAGKLLINNTTGSGTGSGAVNVGANGTLGGTGAISGAVNVTGALSPGASIETLGTGTLSFANGSTLIHELDSSVLTSSASDLAKVSGDLNFNGTVTLSLTDIAVTDVAFSLGTIFSLINYTGVWNNGLFTFGGNELADEEVFTAGLNSWRISYNDAEGGLNFAGEHAGGPDSFVNLTAVPEPGAALLGGLGMLALLRRRR